MPAFKLVDLTQATNHQVSLRGCPKCEEACYSSLNGTPKCGLHGSCRNPLTLTEDFTCTCGAGYQPTLNQKSGQTSVAACDEGIFMHSYMNLWKVS